MSKAENDNYWRYGYHYSAYIAVVHTCRFDPITTCVPPQAELGPLGPDNALSGVFSKAKTPILLFASGLMLL